MEIQGDESSQDQSETGTTTPGQAGREGKTKRATLVWILSGIVAVLLVIVVVGVFVWRPWLSPTPSTSSTPSATPAAATPTPTPTPVASALTISITGLELKDSAGGVIWTHALTDEGNVVAADLQTAFGIPPTVTDRTADPYSIYETEYRWDGFVLITNRPIWDDSPESIFRAYQVWAQTASLGPIAISTPEGLAVGQSADVLAPYADASTFDSGSVTCYAVERDPVQGIDDPARGGMFTGPFLGVCSDNASALIITIMSPDYLFLDT